MSAAPRVSTSGDVVTAGRRVGTVRQSESGSDPFAGIAPQSPGSGPQAGRRANQRSLDNSSDGGALPTVPLSPTPRELRTSTSFGIRPSPIHPSNPSSQIKSPGTNSPVTAQFNSPIHSPIGLKSPTLSLPSDAEAAVPLPHVPLSPVTKAVFKPGFGFMNGRTSGPSILDETLAIDKPLKPGKGGFSSIPQELREPGDKNDLVLCKVCGRQFKTQSYAKHVGHCERQVAQKREIYIYSSLGARVKNTPTEKYVDPATYAQENPPPSPIAERRATSSWRAQREDMKRAMTASRQAERMENGL